MRLHATIKNYLTQRGGMSADEIRAAIAEGIHARNNTFVEDSVRCGAISRNTATVVADEIAGDGAAASHRPQLGQIACQAVCASLHIRIVVLHASYQTELAKVTHSVDVNGLDGAPMVGVVFHSQSLDAAGESGHFEAVFCDPVNSVSDDDIFSLVSSSTTTTVVRPFLPSSEAEQRRIALVDESGRECNTILHNASLLQLDGLHALKGVMLEVAKSNDLALLFCRSLRDAIYVEIADFRDQFYDVEARLRGQELSNKEKLALRETKGFRKTVPRTIPSKVQLRSNIMNVMNDFRGKMDSSGSAIITDRVEDAIRRLLADVDAGLLSDPPGIFMYVKDGVDSRTGMISWRCLRGTNAVENLHLHLFNYIKGMTNMGARLTVALLMEFLFQHNMRSCFRYHSFEDSGTTDIFEFEAMVRMMRELRNELDLGPEFGASFDWYPLIDTLADSGPFVVTPIPAGGSFAVLDPIREHCDQLKGRKLDRTDRVLAKFQELPLPLCDVHNKDEHAFFAEHHARYLTSSGSGLDSGQFAEDWNRAVVDNPQLSLFPKLACMLDAYLPVFQRNSSKRAAMDAFREEVDLFSSVEQMASDYSGPSPDDELREILGDSVVIAPPPESTTTPSLVVHNVVPAIQTSDATVTHIPVQPAPDDGRRSRKRRHRQKTDRGTSRKRAPRRCVMCQREDCPSPSLAGRYPDKCMFKDDWIFQTEEEARQALQTKRRRSQGVCSQCHRPDCRGGTLRHACDYIDYI